MNTSLIAIEQGKRLKKARIARSATNHALKNAKKACEYFGWNYGTYYDHERGRNRLNSAASKYAKAFDVTEAWLITGEGEVPDSPKLPVLGHAGAAITGFNVIENSAIDWLKRPSVLDEIDDAYAIWVEGNSMEPQYYEGDLCIVHPHRLPTKGDTIIIQQSNKLEPPVAFIKIFVKRTKTHLIAEQHNPKAEIQYPLDTVIHAHKVLSVKELYSL